MSGDRSGQQQPDLHLPTPNTSPGADGFHSDHRAGSSGASNRTYVVGDGHVFEQISDENGVMTPHMVCNQEHDGVLCEEVR